MKTNISATSTSDFTLVSYKRNKNNANSNSVVSPVSPILKAITTNQPSLISNSSISSSLPVEVVMAFILDSGDKAVNEESQFTRNHATSSCTITDFKTVHYDNNHFDLFICIVKYACKLSNIGPLHPLQFDKLIYKRVDGVAIIQSAEISRVKIAISSAATANTFLNSPILIEFNRTASNPSSLIYSFGINWIEQFFTEEDFWDGVSSPICLIGFKRVSSFKAGLQIPSKLVQLKFKSTSLHDFISIYNVNFKVELNVHSLTHCKKCWRFGHTKRFCRDKLCCDFYSPMKHSALYCPIRLAPNVTPSCKIVKVLVFPSIGRVSNAGSNAGSLQEDLNKLIINKPKYKTKGYKKKLQLTSC